MPDSLGEFRKSCGFTAGSKSPAGPLFGGTAGANFQMGNWVLGVESDIDGNWMRDSNSTGSGICSFGGCAIQTSWFATARGRVGYAFDRALLYLTFGGAFGDVQMSVGSLCATSSRAGWTIGTGIEYAFLGPWSVKLEYLHSSLGAPAAALPPAASTPMWISTPT